MPFPVLPAIGVGVAGLLVYKVATADEDVPKLQSLRHTRPNGRRVQVVVPVSKAAPELSVTDVPIAGVNAQVIRQTSPGARYVPPTVIKKQQSPGRLDFLPTLITPTGAATLAVVTLSDVQNALNTLGYGPLVVDGKMGPATQSVVIDFQRKAGILADGKPGPETKRRLEDALATLAAPGSPIGAHPAVAQATAATPSEVALSLGAQAVGPQAASKAMQAAQAYQGIRSLFTGSGPKSFFGRDIVEEYEGRGYELERPVVGARRPNALRRRGALSMGESLVPQLDGRDKEIRGGRVRLVFQVDGNLVLYRLSDNVALWSSGTSRRGVSRLTMFPDGSLVILGNDGRPLWESGTKGNPGAALEVRDEDAVIRSPRTGKVVWSASQGHTPSGVQPVGISAGLTPRLPAPPPPAPPPPPPPGAPTNAPSTTLPPPAVSANVSVGASDANPLYDPLYSSLDGGQYLTGGRPVRTHVETLSDVQVALNRLGVSPELSISGALTPRTVAATKAFQITRGLVADGLPGPKTKTALTLALLSSGQSSDFGLTLFTLFGSEPPPVGSLFGAARRRSSSSRSSHPGASAASASRASSAKRSRHRHHKQDEQDQQDGGGGDSGGGGGDSSGGGGDSGGGGGAGDGGGGQDGAVDSTDHSEMSGVGAFG